MFKYLNDDTNIQYLKNLNLEFIKIKFSTF